MEEINEEEKYNMEKSNDYEETYDHIQPNYIETGGKKHRSNSESSSSSLEKEHNEGKFYEPKIDYPTHEDSSDSEEEGKNDEPEPNYTRKRTVEEKRVALSGYGIDIKVTDPQIKSGIIRKHVMYTVSGTDSVGGFHVQRRYKEFLALRKVLIIEWPGCCILQLPPKQAIGNLEPNFIESRRKLLEYFLKTLSKYNYLLISEEFQLFLRGPVNFHKQSIVSKSPNFIVIGNKYTKVFESYSAKTTNPEIELEIKQYLAYFQQGKGLLERLEKTCKISENSYNAIDQDTVTMIQGIKELSTFYISNPLDVPERNKEENPYGDLVIWCRNILLEVGGIVEVINRRADIEKYKSTLGMKIEGEKANIEKRKAGKKKIVQYFNKKSQEYYISRSENEINQLEETIRNIDVIINVSGTMILQDEIPEFKNKKLETLLTANEISIDILQKELTSIVKQLKELEKNI
ncbi:hypothetical protein SteCoe_30347 [Stentor coeruleus]|uniref:PX domain-containing protein n=1 Tax=Stentor coeruleus TaxID=5963 RepID=A0A1R2B3V9_9CILI|nr:hypothetical protein SteCoe_30347 [Stentor coeruleus]